jgi:hypothetical protein
LRTSSSIVFLLGFSWNIVSLFLLFGDDILGILEGLFKAILESLPSLGSSGLSLSSSLGSLGLESGSSLSGSLLLLFGDELSLFLSEWVELVHQSLVLKRILLGLVVDSDVLSNFSQLGLNLVRVDDSCDISTSHNWSVQGESGFLRRFRQNIRVHDKTKKNPLKNKALMNKLNPFAKKKAELIAK